MTKGLMNKKSGEGVRGKQRREEKNVCVQSGEKKELEERLLMKTGG